MGIVSGGLVTQYGFYNPWLFFGSITIVASSAVFSTWGVEVSNSMIIGNQILIGAGTPMLIQMVSRLCLPAIHPSVGKIDFTV